jgi:CRP-like cAMP-binding protein
MQVPYCGLDIGEVIKPHQSYTLANFIFEGDPADPHDRVGRKTDPEGDHARDYTLWLSVCSEPMSNFFDLSQDLPVRSLVAGEVLVIEDQPVGHLYVVVDGRFSVTRGGVSIATVTDPGAIFGEVSALLGTDGGATVTAETDAQVQVIDDPAAFLDTHPEAMGALARLLADRLNRLVAVLSDITTQYADADGNLGLLGDVLGTLTFSSGREIEPGSERDPNPLY